MTLSSRTHRGDVSLNWRERKVFAECKGGPAKKSNSGKERVTLQNAIGQVVTRRAFEAEDLLIVAVPDTPAFDRLRGDFIAAPLMKACCISVVLVSSHGVRYLPGA